MNIVAKIVVLTIILPFIIVAGLVKLIMDMIDGDYREY